MTANRKDYVGNIPFGIGHHYISIDKRTSFREQQSWEHSWQDGFELKPNKKFFANLQFDSMSRGRSAANFEAILHEVDGLENEDCEYLNGCHVNIFMTDMLDIIKNATISNGTTNTYMWTFCKRGSNYGIRMVLYAN